MIDTYTYGLQRISSKGETTETYLYDGRGSVVGVVGASNEFVSYSYTAYGELMPNSPQPHTFGYNGEQTDYATGMQYLRARYYDTGIQRFIQEDDYKGKFTNPISMNRYAYVHNNPVMGVDPSGYSLNRTIGQRILTGEKNQGIYKSSPIRKPSDKEKYGLTDGGSGMTAQDHRLADSLEQRQEDEKDIQDKVEAERVVAAEAAATAEAYRCAQSQEQEEEENKKWWDVELPSWLPGAALIAVGVVAIALTIVAAPAILAVSATVGTVLGLAAIVGAGAVTVGVGVCEIQENNGQGNWLKDELLNGNEKVYSAVKDLALIGSIAGIFTVLPFVAAGATLWKSGEAFKNTFGNTNKPMQNHHFATDKNKTYTPQFEKIADKYDMSLSSSQNIESMPHQGRHPNAYHDYMLEQLQSIDKVANGDKDIFLELFNALKQEIVDNPDMLYKDFWGK